MGPRNSSTRWFELPLPREVVNAEVLRGAYMLLLRGVRASAADQSGAFDVMLGDMDVNRLFNDGALSFSRAVNQDHGGLRHRVPQLTQVISRSPYTRRGSRK
jgi:hypothetical protein